MVFENLVKQILKEQSNPVLPVNLPSPEEKTQKQQTFQQQQQKSVQDIKNLALSTLDVAKFIDPTGILSWGDAYEAYKQFTKLPSPLNGLILGIALCSIIPVGKYYASPAKAALKAGKIAEASKLLKTALPKLEQNLATVATKGMDTKVVQQALNAGEQNIEGSLQKLITTDAKTAVKPIGGVKAEAGFGNQFGNYKFEVNELIKFAQGYKTQEIPLSQIQKTEAFKNIPASTQKGSLERIQNADYSYPVILQVDERGNITGIGDGTHRIRAAIRDNKDTIPAKLIPVKDWEQFKVPLLSSFSKTIHV